MVIFSHLVMDVSGVHCAWTPQPLFNSTSNVGKFRKKLRLSLTRVPVRASREADLSVESLSFHVHPLLSNPQDINFLASSLLPLLMFPVQNGAQPGAPAQPPVGWG